ncbi:MAG: thioredoxin reductase [Myxococcota bacterium]
MNDASTWTDTLIVGFGLTAIPLIRELDREGRDYTVVSSGKSVWERLEDANRLDFDLVSSYMSSVYSFEQIESQHVTSRYPTAREFHDVIAKYKKILGRKVVDDLVTKIENHPEHSVVTTRSGRVYRTKNLVLATAFKRKIDHTTFGFDFNNTRGKTVVLTHMGDSSNLYVSKLVPRGNRVILLNNGFFCLDKMIFHRGIAYALDDVEMHNISQLSGYLYKMALPQGQLATAGMPKICGPFFGSNFLIKHPHASRNLDLTPSLDVSRGSPFTPTIPNGIKVIKYWPIDTYKKLFDRSLEESIARGFLLNDITYFVEQGLVELWPYQEASLDRESAVVKWKDQVVEYDHIIDGDQEVPNLPEIIIKRPGRPDHRYQYYYRDCFMGILPRDLQNIFLLGYTRPMTGGLNNITEMQCLFTHKMIVDEPFRAEMTRDLDAKIDAYNQEHHVSRVRVGADNVVFYGQYTEQLARLMGIHPRLSDCRSLEDLSIYYFFPNAACKYRQSGPYQIEGMSELVRKVHAEHQGYAISKVQLLNFCLTLVTSVLALVLLYLTQLIPLPFAVLVLLLTALVFSPVLSLVNANSSGIANRTNLLMLAGLGLTLLLRSPLVPLATLAINFLAVYIGRKRGTTRGWFNDMRYKDKPEFRDFYARYQAAFDAVYGNPEQSRG